MAMPEALPARKKWFIMSVLVMLTMAAWVLTIYQVEGSVMMPHMPGMPMGSETEQVTSTRLSLE